MAYNARIETFINVKINFGGQTQRLKLPLRDLVPSTLPAKLCQLLDIPEESGPIFERYSDSARAYVVLDPNNVSSYKQLYRAARAKLRLRLRATVNARDINEALGALAISDEKTSVTDTLTNSNVSSSKLSSHTLSESDNITPQIVDSLDKSNPTKPMYDVLQRLQNVHSNEKIDLNNVNDQATNTCHETKLKNSTIINFSEPSMKKKCPYLSRISNEGHGLNGHGVCKNVSLTPTQCPFNQRNYKEIEEQKSSLSKMFHTLTVYCNNCEARITNQHYHCSNCDNGDYDLCQKCVENGIVCRGENHWLIKRFIKDGEPVNSITETIISKSQPRLKEVSKFNQISQTLATRTCNCCIKEFSDEQCVTCTNCPDYDLCISCHVALNHGHHPMHAFEPVVKDQSLEATAQELLAPGRNIEHDATCDGCDKFIYGVRYKCSDCPDWDYCSVCILNAKTAHPYHRFIPIYEQLDRALEINRPCYYSRARHHGVFCDGPHCKNISSYICGDRYKCAVCNDTDFCANCEASPENKHNLTHPLIKLKTPIRNVNVTTLAENFSNEHICDKGTEASLPNAEGFQAVPSSAATQVQTIFELRPSEISNSEKEKDESDQKSLEISSNCPESFITKPESQIIAHFVRDSIVDGTIMLPDVVFTQTWYLRNAGKDCWPSGCFIKCVSGTYMGATDSEHCANTHDLDSANRTPPLDFVVTPGQVIGFTVLLRAPCDSGAYTSFWRLVTPNGQVVGPKLWCEITVKKSIPASTSGRSQPKSVDSSQMVFPTLENEIINNNDFEPSSKDVVSDEEGFDDLSEESMTYRNRDEFFLTDDEYDILDASDEEYVAEQQKRN